MLTVPKALEEALLQHFIYHKLEISYAINKPFPFFESLRDKCFITEKMYMESLEACQNLVPISRVVYNILTKLETTFGLSLLLTLFSPLNLCEYPNLGKVFRSFRSVGNACRGWSRVTPISSEVQADPAEGSSSARPLLQALLPPPPSLPSCLPHVQKVSRPEASTQLSNEILSEVPHPTGPAVVIPGLIQERRISPGPSEKCTENEKGAWATPKEAEIAGNQAEPRMLCMEKTTEQLPERGAMLRPLRENLMEREEERSEGEDEDSPAEHEEGTARGTCEPGRWEQEHQPSSRGPTRRGGSSLGGGDGKCGKSELHHKPVPFQSKSGGPGPRGHKATENRKRVDCPALPPGWQMEEVIRKSRRTARARKSDVYYFSPSGKKLRSKVELARYLGTSVDLSSFNYRTGKMEPGE